MKIFISAGEASGDALGAALLKSLHSKIPELNAFGMGGPGMKALGFNAVYNSNELGVVGLFEVLRHLPRLFRLRDDLANLAIKEKPDLAVLIDVPDFNIRLAKKLKAENIPVVFYVGPSVWAWRPGRAARYAKHIDKLLVLFPFELPIWKKHDVDVSCVGHPLIDEIPDAASRVASSDKTLALLPGSRPSEIARHFETMLRAAVRLKEEGLVDRFVLPLAPSLDAQALIFQIKAAGLEDSLNLIIAKDGNPEPRRKAVSAACVALVASGTATLEVALLGIPQVVVYRMNALTWFFITPFIKLKQVGLVNLIAGREIAPELLQGEFNVGRVFKVLKRLFTDREARETMIEASLEVRNKLGESGAADRAATAVLDMFERGTSKD
jgi:lipid-A-disaccharide synthase